ncbi:MAG: HAD family hydrolase, partial [Nitrospinota bacterium]
MHIVLFDIDGTLIHSDGAGRRALALAFEKAHAWENALEGLSLHGMTDQAILESVYLRRRQAPPTPAETARLFGIYLKVLSETLEESPGFRVLPGVGRLLARLSVRKDTLSGLATGNIERGARLKLSHAGL